ncbi:uncharacterized protein L201_006490 [Kwoniella dendrophila CBS 6074]|uniref:FHA domain-containing protein n=1 Tax=Kwoniella dendrophila CBS 6074 TaxID=1295534 RepID=A0AAX4K2D6_9TREE
MSDIVREVDPPADWFISLTENQTSKVTYLTLTQLLAIPGPVSSGRPKGIVHGGVILDRKSSTLPSQDGQFDSPILSRSHAQLTLTPNCHVHMTDLGSMHGTFINSPQSTSAPWTTENKPVVVTTAYCPQQLLDGDVISLGKRVYSLGWYEPIKLMVKFRYIEFGKGSTADGGRKKIDRPLFPASGSEGKWANITDEVKIRRLIKNTLSSQNEKRKEEMNFLEEGVQLLAESRSLLEEKWPLLRRRSASHHVTPSVAQSPEVGKCIDDDEDSVRFSHAILKHDKELIVNSMRQSQASSNSLQAQGSSQYLPIDLRSPRAESPVSVRSDDVDQETTIAVKSNTYKVPNSILYASENEESLPRGSSEESDGELDEDEGSMTDYEEHRDPDIAKDEDQNIQEKLSENYPSIITFENHNPEKSDQPSDSPFKASTPPGPPSPGVIECSSSLIASPGPVSPDYGAWYSYSSEDEDVHPLSPKLTLDPASPTWSPVSPGIPYTVKSPSPVHSPLPTILGPMSLRIEPTNAERSEDVDAIVQEDEIPVNIKDYSLNKVEFEDCYEENGLASTRVHGEDEDDKDSDEDEDRSIDMDSQDDEEDQNSLDEDSDVDSEDEHYDLEHPYFSDYDKSEAASSELSEEEDDEDDNSMDKVSVEENSDEDVDYEEDEGETEDEDDDDDEHDDDSDDEDDDNINQEDIPCDNRVEDEPETTDNAIETVEKASTKEADRIIKADEQEITKSVENEHPAKLDQPSIQDYLQAVDTTSPVQPVTAIDDQSPAIQEDISKEAKAELSQEFSQDQQTHEVVKSSDEAETTTTLDPKVAADAETSKEDSKVDTVDNPAEVAQSPTEIRLVPRTSEEKKEYNSDKDRLKQIFNAHPPASPSSSSVASSDGPVTPPNTKKRLLPEDFTIVNPIQTEDHGTTRAQHTVILDAEAERPMKKLRKVGSAIGYIALGAALGGVGTIAGLMRLAE